METPREMVDMIKIKHQFRTDPKVFEAKVERLRKPMTERVVSSLKSLGKLSDGFKIAKPPKPSVKLR